MFRLISLQGMFGLVVMVIMASWDAAVVTAVRRRSWSSG